MSSICGDGIDRKLAGDALVIDRHHDRREARAEIFVELAALAGMAIGARHPRAVALDRQARRRFDRCRRCRRRGRAVRPRSAPADIRRCAASIVSRAYSRSHVFSKSRCLIDLTIDGLALSNSKAAIPDSRKSRMHRPGRKIFYESAANAATPLTAAFGRPAGFLRERRSGQAPCNAATKANAEAGASASIVPSFPPCLIPSPSTAYSAPGGGSPGRFHERSRESLPEG